MRQRYDASSKWLIENFADAIPRLAGVTDLVSFMPLPGEVVQSRQLPDGLVEVVRLGHPAPLLFLIEINTYPDNRIASELLADVLLTYLNKGQLPEVVTLVLCPKGNVTVQPRVGLASPLAWTELAATWRVVNLWELSAADFLPLTDPGLAPWVPLTRIDGPPEPVLQQCRDVIDERTTGSRNLNLLAVSQVLGNLVYDKELLKRIFTKEGQMIESPILTEWFTERELLSRQETILKLLETQFGVVPADIRAGIKLVTDDVPLLALNRAAARCNTLDEFRAALSGL